MMLMVVVVVVVGGRKGGGGGLTNERPGHVISVTATDPPPANSPLMFFLTNIFCLPL